MKITNAEKQNHALEIYRQIDHCKTEEELEKLCDKLDDLMFAGYVFKKDYKFLCEEMDNKIMDLVEYGLI